MPSTLSLLRRAVLVVLVVVGLPQFAQADFIDLISQSFHIQGLGTGIAYDQTSATPIARSDTVLHYNDRGQVDGTVHITTSTDGGVASQSAFVQAQTDTYDLGNALLGSVDATAAITFRPLVSSVVVQIEDPWGNPFFGWGASQLYDATAGVAVLTVLGLYTPAAYDVSLNLAHVYTIFSSSSGMGVQRGATLSMSPASVPDSGSTLTFFVVGFGALVIHARSQRFSSST